MPKVDKTYLEARRQQIIDAATACFSHRGFHQTTMQEICREAEMSPGAVYRYFKSKEDIIQSMAQQSRERNMSLIECAQQEGETLAVVRELAASFFGMLQNNEACALDIELWGEAVRNGAVREVCEESLRSVRAAFTDIIRQAQERGEINSELDAASVAGVMISMFDGLIIQKAVSPEIDVWKYVETAMAMFSGKFWTAKY